MHPKLGLAE